MLVEFFTSSYAPCMVQARIVNRATLAKVRRLVQENGGPDEETALLSWEDAEEILGERLARRLRRWDSVTARIDRFIALTLYGYDANTL